MFKHQKLLQCKVLLSSLPWLKEEHTVFIVGIKDMNHGLQS